MTTDHTQFPAAEQSPFQPALSTSRVQSSLPGPRLDADALTALTESSPDIIFTVGCDGLIAYINRSGARRIEQQCDQIVGRPLASFLREEAASQLSGRLKEVFAIALPVYHEAMWTFPHGDLWLGTWLIPLRDPQGVVTTVLGTARDLTLGKHTEHALRDSEERYRRLVELAPYAMVVHHNGIIAFVNNAGLQLLGARRHKEVLGRPYLEFVPTQHLDDAKQRISQVLDLGARTPFQETQFLRLDGIAVDVEEMSTPFEFRGEPAVQVIARDITETKRLAGALEQSLARFERFFRASPAAMWLAAPADGRFLEVNDNFLHVCGFSRDEVVGRTGTELGIWADPVERDKLFDQVRLRGTVHSFEAKLLRGDRQVRHVIISVESLRFASGPCMLFAALDVTDRKQLEEKLRQSQRLEAIGLLARGIAHDFNNILTVIHGHTRLIQMLGNIDDTVSDSLSQIEDAAQRAGRLTRQLLTFSRHQPLQPRVTDLNEIIRGLTQMLCRTIGEDIVLEFSPAASLPSVMADIGMIEQVLLNLAVNARDAMPKGGRLLISTAEITVDAGQARLAADAAPGVYVCLSVQDTGEGIAPETLPRIFEPFYTTKEPGKGTGLGLATVQSIVQQHKGWIDVESRLQRGTTFRVYLPAVRTTTPRASAEAPPTVMPTGQETILLVEDESGLRELCSEVLERCGYKVLTAADGLEALSIWQRRQGKVNLLLSDVVMPGGLNGWELAQRMATDDPALKVVLTSGYSFDAAKSRSSFLLRWRFLEKPYLPEVLAQTIRESLDAG